MTHRPCVMTLALGLMVTGATLADAQVLGTFAWQQAPYCNVISLTVTQVGGVYRVEGFDDQCQASRRAAATGMAVPNPDGSIGFGLTVVTNSGATGGAPLHLDATIALSSLGGSWRDSVGRSGAWTFAPAGASGGTPRPTANPAGPAVFTAGLSAGDQRISAVGTPVQASDAAPRGYVDMLRPVVAHVSKFGSSAPLSSTCLTYLPVTVVAPGPGTVVAVANVQIQLAHTTGTISHARAGMNDVATDCPEAPAEIGDAMQFVAYTGEPSTLHNPLGSVTRVFDVPAAGTYTYYLNGYRVSGGTMVFIAANITATWYPK
jgi:hypothetical protein